MHTSFPSLERPAVAAAFALLFATFAAVLVSTLAPWPVPLLVPLAALAATPRLARALPDRVDGAARRHPVLFTLWSLLAVACVAETARLALFMADPTRTSASVLPQVAFYVKHSCLSAYYEGALHVGEAANVYDPSLYASAQGEPHHIGPFEVDAFLYPPPFLLLPRAALALTRDFLAIRAAWFAVDGALVAGGLLAVARFVGGRSGLAAALLAPAVILALPTQVTLQTGNFHLAAIAGSAVAMVLLARGRRAAGGALLGFLTLAKVFPGILIVVLVVRRRWRDLGWTLGACAAFAAAALAAFGTAPFAAFFGFELPRIASGEAFPFLSQVVSINHSVVGLVMKVAHFTSDPAVVSWAPRAAWVYSAIVLALAAWSARRAPASPFREAALWIGLLHLASLRSPFVPGDYALFAPLWLLVLAAAPSIGRPRVASAFVAAWIALAFLKLPPSVSAQLVVETLLQLGGAALAAWLVVAGPPAVDAADVPAPQAQPA
jgi:hypothetical protein